MDKSGFLILGSHRPISAAAGCRSRPEASNLPPANSHGIFGPLRSPSKATVRMSGSGEHGTTQPVPGPEAAPDRREETADAATRGRERRRDPDNNSEVDVIALSPRALTEAANPFACDASGKGFRARAVRVPGGVVRAPRPGAPRAPGDLAGIRSHYRRRHGHGAGRIRKWKCDLCGERHGAGHDWEAHARVCGVRKYGCGGCGAAFSRQDSFVTHRAFCSGVARRAENVATVASALLHCTASRCRPKLKTAAPLVLARTGEHQQGDEYLDTGRESRWRFRQWRRLHPRPS